jgi:DNA-binding CsgD family transcriptional regulator
MARAEARRAVRQIAQRQSVASHLPEPIAVPEAHPMALLDGLSPMDSEIARRLADGLSQREVAKQMGLGRQQVRGAIQRIREQLIDSDE